MEKQQIVKLHGLFEESAYEKDGQEYWFARDLMKLLGYSQWKNFVQVVEKAKIACKNASQQIEDHFSDVGKMVEIGSGTERTIEDIVLTRYACYLVAQNGDPRKEEIAFAMTYFAVQTRKLELIEQRLLDWERLQARNQLKESDKLLSGVLFEHGQDGPAISRIKSRGDTALFGGNSTAEMKKKLGVPDKKPLADYLPTITIKAKDFVNEITSFNVKKENMHSETQISQEHVRNNTDVRSLLADRGIRPEDLPAERDVTLLEREVKSQEKLLVSTKPSKGKNKKGEKES